jgi:hypothetical protein
VTSSPIRLDSRAAFFCALLPLGFIYVAVVLCHRANPFASLHDPWGDWLGVTLSGPALFLFAAQYVLKPLSSLGALRTLLHYGAGYLLPFFAGLHWEYIGRISGANFSLTARQLSHLSFADVTMLIVGAVVFIGMSAICLREAQRAGTLSRYLGAFFGLIAVLIVLTLLLGPSYHVHIHHYFWALCLTPFVRFPNPACTVVQAFLVGAYVEGASRWGFGAIWNLQ